MPMSEDFSVFFNTSEFATEALFGPNGSQASINGIFENEFYEVEQAEYVGISAKQPTFSCATTQVASYSQGAKVVINGTEYEIRDIRDDGTGLSQVILWKR